MALQIEVLCTAENFDEASYLAANPDVARAVAQGRIKSGREHFNVFGRNEARRIRASVDLREKRRAKIGRIHSRLRLDMNHTLQDGKFNFLTEELRKETLIVETAAVSANSYDANALALVEKFSEGLILDCGAGRRDRYFDNVVNFEIVDYDTTDIIGVGEELPFKNDSFDAVLSLAVLEHVRDPFRCAREIARVLKPGGQLLCCVPFLQPVHGYPHHYFNMTSQGLTALFMDHLIIDRREVLQSMLPIWSLTWIVQSWAAGLQGSAKEEFLNLSIRDLLQRPAVFLNAPWVTSLPTEKNFEIACGTMLQAHKPPA